MKKTLKKTAVIFLAVMMTFLSAVPAYAGSDEFSDHLYDEWKETVESDYLTMHSSVYDWRELGLTKPEVTFGDISIDSFRETVSYAEEALEKLHEFDIEELDETEWHDYMAFEAYLENSIDMYSYPEFQFMFRPFTGYLINVIDYFADFMFYEKQDVEDYLTLIEELPSYIDQMKEFTEAQAKEGYFLDDLGYTDAMSELNEMIEKGENCPLVVNFENNIDGFDGISDAEKAEYKERNRTLISGSIIPAIRDVRAFLSELKGSRSVQSGALIEYEPGEGTADGLEYYKALVKYSASSSDSLEDIFDYLTKAITESYDYLDWLFENDTEFTSPGKIEGMESIEDVLSYLRANMQGFPEGPDVDYTPSYLPPGSNDFAMAYYIPAPVDNIRQNIIRVNKQNTNDLNTLYYVLAHEGFPGHLYQFTWYQASEGYKPLRHELTFMGYEEGWANYVERTMLLRSGLDKTSAEYLYLSEILSFMIYAASDIAVNGLGYDQEELSEYIENVGFDPAYAEELYELSVEMPGSYIPYGYGAARFLEFRERAEQALGDDFDEEEFHEVLLTYGPRPFELVEEDLEAYVESKGERLPDDFTFFGSELPEKTIFEAYPLLKYLAGLIVVIIAAVIVIIINKKRRKMDAEITDSVD
ncbi:MAG: DUF885 domain-containing protein [Firmicutes bacterium]|nr:DUF885 domain-containing protein [Bacillota bacterium]